MAQSVYRNCHLTVGSTDMSALGVVKSCVPNFDWIQHDDTAHGDTALSRSKGLQDWAFDIELFQDFADDGVDEKVYTAWAAGTCAIIWRPDSAAVGVNNPQFSGTGIIPTYQPVADGVVGAKAAIKFRVQSQGTALTRATAA